MNVFEDAPDHLDPSSLDPQRRSFVDTSSFVVPFVDSDSEIRTSDDEENTATYLEEQTSTTDDGQYQHQHLSLVENIIGPCDSLSPMNTEDGLTEPPNQTTAPVPVHAVQDVIEIWDESQNDYLKAFINRLPPSDGEHVGKHNVVYWNTGDEYWIDLSSVSYRRIDYVAPPLPEPIFDWQNDESLEDVNNTFSRQNSGEVDEIVPKPTEFVEDDNVTSGYCEDELYSSEDKTLPKQKRTERTVAATEKSKEEIATEWYNEKMKYWDLVSDTDEDGCFHLDKEQDLNVPIVQEYFPIFRSMTRGSENNNDREFCYTKCDLDSVAGISSSLLKLIWRLTPKDSSFEIYTRIDPTNIDIGSRFLIKPVSLRHFSGDKSSRFCPHNKHGTGLAGDVRLCRFKNVSLGTMSINSCCTYISSCFEILVSVTAVLIRWLRNLSHASSNKFTSQLFILFSFFAICY